MIIHERRKGVCKTVGVGYKTVGLGYKTVGVGYKFRVLPASVILDGVGLLSVTFFLPTDVTC